MVNAVVSGCMGKMARAAISVITQREDIAVSEGIDLRYDECEVLNLGFPVVKNPKELSCHPDVIIDFSHPSALGDLLEYAKTNGTALVLGTTGYSPEEVQKIKTAAFEIPIFFTANMSIGINLLRSLAKKAASVLGGQFDIEIVEKHHNQKIDAPSGTALMLADSINEAMGESLNYIYDRHSVRKKRAASEIGIHSVRGGTIVGEHEIIFAGRDEVITLSHSAMSKEAFAVGAVNAAVFVTGKPAGLYTMEDLVG